MQKLQLSIPEPCHQNWHHMTPTDQGRFCNACAKEVVDFSMMTDTEVLNYFTTLTHEKVCGRALPSQLDRTIYRPKDPKKRLFWYWNYIVMFLMFFTKANTVKAQGGIKPVTEISPVKANETVVTVAGYAVRRTDKIITGKVTDIDGNPVSFASIKIKGASTGVSADANAGPGTGIHQPQLGDGGRRFEIDQHGRRFDFRVAEPTATREEQCQSDCAKLAHHGVGSGPRLSRFRLSACA